MNPGPPEELATAMRNALDDAGTPTAEDLLAAAERILDRVLRTDCEARASALDLLTVDALVTHALELASKDPNAADDFPEQALSRISSAWE
ncbi:MAG: hypothetical protein M3Z18_09485 [Gemmatimonadota bacterium]|nr:hypothetical protein [Gemmatimonadota bacterium]